LLTANGLEHADQSWPAEEAMDRDPKTFRLNASQDEVSGYFQNRRDINSVLITSTDGKLFGLLKREDLEKKPAE
jgi:hypothetical protein